MKNSRLLASGLVLGIMSSAASAGFIINDEPVPGNSWTQRVMMVGSFDYVAFEIVTDNGGGPFELPAISSFTDAGNGSTPVADWNSVFDNPGLIHASGPAFTGALEFDLHMDGNMSQAVTLRGVAFLNGVFQFSAEFVWLGAGLFAITDEDVWDPDPTSLPGAMVPLPAPIWLGSLGLLGVLVIRRRLI